MKSILFIVLSLTFFQFSSNAQSEKKDTLDRESAIKYTKLAAISIGEGREAFAIKQLVSALKFDSTYRDIYIQYYWAGIRNESYTDTAIHYLKKGIDIFNKDDVLYFYLGELFYKKSDYDKALEQYNKAIVYSLEKGDDFKLKNRYRFQRANAFFELEQYDKAIIDYNYVINKKPDLVLAVFNRGVCYDKIGKHDEACSDWEKAVELKHKPAEKLYQKNCMNEKQLK